MLLKKIGLYVKKKFYAYFYLKIGWLTDAGGFYYEVKKKKCLHM